MENISSLNGLGHGIEQWVRQMERLTPLASQDCNQLLELFVAQTDLDSLLTTFADRAARIVRIHSLYFDHGQPHRLIQQPSQFQHGQLHGLIQQAPQFQHGQPHRLIQQASELDHGQSHRLIQQPPQFQHGQPHRLIQQPPQASLKLHSYPFELRGQHGQLLGQLHYQLEHSLSGSQQRILQQYHQLLSLPLPLHLRLAQLEQQVRLDHLTGLGNRAYFEEAIGRAVEQHGREPHGLVLVLLDLDHFKEINDTWGHPVGDLVLSRFANLLKECIRGTDQAFRLGGDEFALLLQPAESEAWRPVWLRLQHMLLTHKELSTFSVGCSLGAASWQSGLDVQSLYEAADAHLYARKRAGKASLLD